MKCGWSRPASPGAGSPAAPPDRPGSTAACPPLAGRVAPDQRHRHRAGEEAGAGDGGRLEAGARPGAVAMARTSASTGRPSRTSISSPALGGRRLRRESARRSRPPGGTAPGEVNGRGAGAGASAPVTIRPPNWTCKLPWTFFAKARTHERLEQLRAARELDMLPYFRVLEGPTLPIVEMEGKRADHARLQQLPGPDRRRAGQAGRARRARTGTGPASPARAS